MTKKTAVTFKAGTMMKATWTDGYTAVGKYEGRKQGYIILIDSEGNRIVCAPHVVEFEVISDKE
tara:strand:+ start:365 stop:556 length:192 start_codon:yes stop_codon:yes gene_type:complete